MSRHMGGTGSFGLSASNPRSRKPGFLLLCSSVFSPTIAYFFLLAITGGSVSFKLSRFASSVLGNKVLYLIEPYQFLPAAGMGTSQAVDSSPPDGTGWSPPTTHYAIPPYANYIQVSYSWTLGWSLFVML